MIDPGAGDAGAGDAGAGDSGAGAGICSGRPDMFYAIY